MAAITAATAKLLLRTLSADSPCYPSAPTRSTPGESVSAAVRCAIREMGMPPSEASRIAAQLNGPLNRHS